MKQPEGLEPLERARALRRLSTDAERLLWKGLRGRMLGGFKFRRQTWIGPFIVDFVCVEARLVVEADGSQHADAEAYDAARSTWLEREGFRVLRFWNHEILTNGEGVLTTILGHLPSPSHSARAERAPSSPPRGEEQSATPDCEREGEGK